MLRLLRPDDLPAVLTLSEGLFPQIDPRRAGLERVFDNANALALAAAVASDDANSNGDEIAGFVVVIVGDAEPGGASDGGSTAAHDYEQIRRLVLEAADGERGSTDGGGAGAPQRPAAPATAAAARAPSPLMSVSVRSARSGGAVRVGCVALLGVAPEHRRKGVARALMRAAAAFAAGLGAAALYLHTPLSNAPAVALYERRLGFVRAAYLPGYYARSRGTTGDETKGDGDAAAVAEGGGGGGEDALLFVRPLFGAARAARPAAVAAAAERALAAAAAGGGRALPPLLPPPPFGVARRPTSAAAAAAAIGSVLPPVPAPPQPAAVSWRVDEGTGEVALDDDEEGRAVRGGDEFSQGDEVERQARAGRPPPPPPPPALLLQRLASVFAPPPRRAAGPPPVRALGEGGRAGEKWPAGLAATTRRRRTLPPLPLRPPTVAAAAAARAARPLRAPLFAMR